MIIGHSPRRLPPDVGGDGIAWLVSTFGAAGPAFISHPTSEIRAAADDDLAGRAGTGQAGGRAGPVT
ncbi:hypothetical protein [Micromonospora haikouensis]|uniref:hypothetical protein n=1 Tax=Micromonospora haikouensis TaxID=686309 RepID=UPI003D75BD6D